MWSVLASRQRASVLWRPGHSDAVRVHPAWVDHQRVQDYYGTAPNLVVPTASQSGLSLIHNMWSMNHNRKAAVLIRGCCVTSITLCGPITVSQRAPNPWSSLSGQSGTTWTDHLTPDPPLYTAGVYMCSVELQTKTIIVQHLNGSVCVLVLVWAVQEPSWPWIGFCSS